jgi:hypothetical protein
MLAVAAVTASACTPESHGSTPETTSASVSVTGRTSASSKDNGLASGGAARVKCEDAVGDTKPSQDPTGVAEVLGAAGLPTGPKISPLQANLSGESNPAYRLFAKRGLLVKAASQLEIVVPAEFASRAAVVWGNPGTPTAHLLFGPCPSTPTKTGWLAYPGGFLVAEPMCLPLLIRTAGREARVQIGVGRSCPGHPTDLGSTAP